MSGIERIIEDVKSGKLIVNERTIESLLRHAYSEGRWDATLETIESMTKVAA